MRLPAIFLIFTLFPLSIFSMSNGRKSETLKKLIKGSDLIARGKIVGVHLDGVDSFASLKILEANGVKENELENGVLDIHFSEKSYDGFIEKEDGISFKANEEIVVLLKKRKDKLFLFNGGLSKYKVEFISGKRFLISNVIARNLDSGEVSIRDFYKLVEKTKKSPMLWLDHGEFVRKSFLEKSLITDTVSDAPTPGRGIASFSSQENSKTKRGPSSSPMAGISVFWLILLLGLIGGAARVIWKN